MIRLLPAVLVFVLWVYCVVDVIGTRDDRVRHLPKVGWLVLVLLFPLVGSIAWLVAGRPQPEPVARSRAVPPPPAAAAMPETDEELRRRIRERAEEQRAAYEEKKRREREQADPET